VQVLKRVTTWWKPEEEVVMRDGEGQEVKKFLGMELLLQLKEENQGAVIYGDDEGMALFELMGEIEVKA
jgi:hypothetical protein